MDDTIAKDLKKVLKFNERRAVQKDAAVTEYDGISEQTTLGLYHFFTEKLSHSIYKKELSTPAKFLNQAIDKFKKLPLDKRCQVLGSILHLFQCNPVLSDLRLLGGSKSTGTIYLNKKIKPEDHVYLIEQSVTGFFEKRILLAPYGGK